MAVELGASHTRRMTMIEGTIGILILLGISGVVAAIIHWICGRVIVACLLSAFVATVLFQIAVSLSLGHLDPFFPLAVAVGVASHLLLRWSLARSLASFAGGLPVVSSFHIL